MDIANEAIQMSEMLSKKRRQKLERDVAGRESLDEANYWHPRSGNFSVFGEPIPEERGEESSFAERDTSPKRPPLEEQPSIREENKLAALNDLIKNQMLNPSAVDDVDSFDTFLTKLSQRRDKSPAAKSETTVVEDYSAASSRDVSQVIGEQDSIRKRLDQEF